MRDIPGLDTQLLEQAIAVNDPVRVERFYRSVFNRVHRRLLFSDVDLQDLARRAEERWGDRIHDAADPRRLRFRAIALLGIEVKLESTDYESAVIQLDSQDGGRYHFDRLKAKREEFEAEVSRRTTGPAYGVTYR